MFNLNSSNISYRLCDSLYHLHRSTSPYDPYARVLSTYSILCHDPLHVVHAVAFHLRRTCSSTFISYRTFRNMFSLRLFPLFIPDSIAPTPTTTLVLCTRIMSFNVYAPVSYRLGLCTHIPFFGFTHPYSFLGLHAHIFFGLRTHVLLPWLTHWYSFPWVYVPISFASGYASMPSLVYIPVLSHRFMYTRTFVYSPFSLFTNMMRYSYTLGLRNQPIPSIFRTHYQCCLKFVPI